MNWIEVNKQEPEPGEYYLIFYEGNFMLASYIINHEFLDNECEKCYPEYYCNLEKP